MLCFVVVTVLLLSGCGSNRPPLGKVEGTVRYNGEPIKTGTVIFSVAGTRDASGVIEDGTIKDITTFTKGDGVPLGEARIAVIVLQELPSSSVTPSPTIDDATKPGGGSAMMTGQRFAVPVKYVNPETSGLTATIKKGSNVINLELTK